MNSSVRTAGLQQVLATVKDWKTRCGEGAIPVLSAIEQCRTAALGYHLYRCTDEQCGHKVMQYHSCRNRHCPHCGTSKKQDWIEARMRELLPCKYYHVVFTIPHELNSVVIHNRKVMFDLLFNAASYTINTFARDRTLCRASSVCCTPGDNN